MDLGERLLSVFSHAENSVRIAAPFIKTHSLERVLAIIPDGVALTCVTRWRPEDIASGVCDLEIFDLLQERQGAALLVHPHLHAKFFAADKVCLIGSANLTHSALGWHVPSNLELLVELDAHNHGLDQWWGKMLTSCIDATQDMKSELRKLADALQSSSAPISRPEADPEDVELTTVWTPECPRWTGLWETYSGDEDQMPASAVHSAKADLAALSLPPGLNEESFQKALAAILRYTKIVQEIEQLSKTGLTDATAHTLLQSLCNIPEKEAPRRWQLLKGWLSTLYPDEYHIETNQEILMRGRTL